VADAVRRAQAVPQPVHDLILAEAGRLGDPRGGVCDQPINFQKGWDQTSQLIESRFLI
jgi:hypothetical protein